LALLGAGSGVVAYLNTLDANKHVLLGSALALFAMWPYTILALLPTNDQLMDGDGKLQYTYLYCTLTERKKYSKRDCLTKNWDGYCNISLKALFTVVVAYCRSRDLCRVLIPCTTPIPNAMTSRGQLAD